MCTLSWDFSKQTYRVFFNRDELKTRKPAESIRVGESGKGVKCIYPVDGEKGGSWIAVNGFGMTTCLLNLYEYPMPKAPEAGFKSRGWLVMELADSESWRRLSEKFSRIELGHYPPFHLFHFEPEMGIHSLKWTGVEVVLQQHPETCEVPASGSSFQNENVVAVRLGTFHNMVSSQDPRARVENLRKFHDFYDPDQGAFSVNMMRDNAQTMSKSEIEVDASRIRFSYRSRLPGYFAYEEQNSESLTIERIPSV